MRSKMIGFMNDLRRRSHELHQVAVRERADAERTVARLRGDGTTVEEEIAILRAERTAAVADVRATALSDVAACLQGALEPLGEGESLWTSGETELAATRTARLGAVLGGGDDDEG